MAQGANYPHYAQSSPMQSHIPMWHTIKGMEIISNPHFKNISHPRVILAKKAQTQLFGVVVFDTLKVFQMDNQFFL